MPTESPRIALVTPYWTPILGGITTFVSNLSSGLRSLGADVAIWTSNGEPSERVRVGPAKKTAFVRWARREMRAWRPDVVHAHAHWYCLAPAFFPIRGKVAPRVVFSVHTAFLRAPWPTRTFLTRLFRKADLLTSVSTASGVRFHELFPRTNPPALLPPGVRELRPPPAEIDAWRRRLDLPRRHPVISMVSMMVWPRKVAGLLRLVESIAVLRKRYPEVLLLVVGDGELRPQVEAEIQRLGVAENVRLLGSMTDPGAILALSDVVCHISYQDSFAQSVLEAMSLGRPVVVNEAPAIDLPGSPEACGLVVTGLDPETISETCAALLDDDERRRVLGERAARTARDQFSWKRSAKISWELYGLRP